MIGFVLAPGAEGYLYQAVQFYDRICQGWLVAVAENWPAAAKAAELIEVTYERGPASTIGEEEILAEGLRLIDDPRAGLLYYRSGDAPSADGDGVHAGVYVTHSVLQMPLEPLNALVWQHGDTWRCPCQRPAAVRHPTACGKGARRRAG